MKAEAKTWSMADRRKSLKNNLRRFSDAELKAEYLASKQLSDLCCQEIKRRKQAKAGYSNWESMRSSEGGRSERRGNQEADS